MDSVTTLNWVIKAQKPLNKILTTCVHTDSTLKRLKHEEGKFEVTPSKKRPWEGWQGKRKRREAAFI